MLGERKKGGTYQNGREHILQKNIGTYQSQRAFFWGGGRGRKKTQKFMSC